MRTVTSRQNPLVQTYRAAAAGRAASLLLDGPHLVQDAIAAQLRITSAAFSTAAFARAPDLVALQKQLLASGCQVASVSARVMDAISPVRAPSGVVALADRPSSTADQIFGHAPQLVVAAVHVQDPGNLGAILRSCEAGGATAVVACDDSADPFGWKALRGSMGSAFRLPIACGWSSADLVRQARARGLRSVVAVPRGGTPMDQVDLAGPVVLLIGGEGPGLAKAVVDAADDRLTIPMHGGVESLNAAVAAALIVYEAQRQRVI